MLFLFVRPAFSQTVIIGGGGTINGTGPIWIHQTGTANQNRTFSFVSQANLNAAGIVNGVAITEWGYNKTSTTELVGSNQWELKVYLKNGNFPVMAGGAFSSLDDGATLVHTSIVNGDTFPVEPSFWMWQLQDYFEYTGSDILCIVEWTPLQNVFNNITNLMSWQATTGGTGMYELASGDSTVTSVGFATRISFVNNLFTGTVTGGTIGASVVNANAGAPFTLLSSNLSYGLDMLYQWQKSPAAMNQWVGIGPESLLPSLPTVLQDTPTDYRLRSTCSTTGEVAFSNVISIGQKSNVVFSDPHLKTAFIRAYPVTQNVKNLAGTYFKPDADNDGEIQLAEALNVSSVTFVTTTAAGIGGIESFENLTKLSFLNEANFSNVAIPALDDLEWLEFNNCSLEGITLGALPELEYLRLPLNNLTAIDLANAPAVRQLTLANNLFESFTIPNNAIFESLGIQDNLLTELTIEGGINFDAVDCSNNQLTSLHIEASNDLVGLVKCSNNQLTSLTVHGMEYIHEVICDNNQLQSLDLSNARISGLDCSNNDIYTLNIRNTETEDPLNFAGNPNLTYICADYPQIQSVTDLAAAQGYPQMSINDYCSFDPIGTERIVTGNSRYSALGDCDASSIVYPHLRLKWSEIYDGGTDFLGYFFTNSLGELHEQLPYFAPSIFEPVLEYPEYFNASPTPFAFNFQEQPSPVSQDFCITPNGVHNDLETLIYPLTEARPGFDATYRIILRNVGTESNSGQITLTYEDAVMNLLSADPAPLGNVFGQLSWSYSDLLPFETRTVLLSFNLNGPGGSPALNIGDALNFNLTATSPLPDVNLYNNQTVWNQPLVNSFDPNDKTCLEGNVVPLEMVGEYVHYVIRFENTGTASAINVVVKDILDAQRFDVNSLVILNSSHPCGIRQRGNAFEFIFEGINLPFAGTQANGFVLFKVKLRNDLVLGDTFSNQASIYFDYNLPIITNNETSVIQELGVGEFDDDASITIYPNPANNIVNVKSPEVIKSIQVYDTAGRIVAVHLADGNETALDVAAFSNGIYYLKVTTENGIGIKKLIKE